MATLDWQADNPTVTIKNHKGRDKVRSKVMGQGKVNLKVVGSLKGFLGWRVSV